MTKDYDVIRKAFDLVSKDSWNDIYENIGVSDLEAAIYDDGYIGIRSEQSSAADEEKVVYIIPLKASYWRETLEEWGIYDEDTDGAKTDIDDDLKDDFIKEVLQDIDF